MTRRAFGSIDQLQSGRWRARYRDGAGRAHSRLFKTKTDASAFLATIETDLLRGDWNDPRLTGVPLRVWAEQWFETTAHLKPKTASSTRRTSATTSCRPSVTSRSARSTRSSVRQFVSALRGDGLEHGTVKKAKAVLSMVLGSAAEAGAIKANPCANIKIGRAARREMVFLTADEVEALADGDRRALRDARALRRLHGPSSRRDRRPAASDASTCCAAGWRSPSRSRSCPGRAWSSDRRRTTSGGLFRCRRSSPTSSPSTSPAAGVLVETHSCSRHSRVRRYASITSTGGTSSPRCNAPASTCSLGSTTSDTRASRCSSPRARTISRSCVGSVTRRSRSRSTPTGISSRSSRKT